MKKTCLIFLFFLLCLTLRTYSQNLKLGIELNPAICWFNESSSVFNNKGVKFGIEGGLILEKYFTSHYAFLSGLKLSNYGLKAFFQKDDVIYTNDESINITSGTEVNFKIQYLYIPLGLKMKTNRIGYFTYFANLGLNPQISIKAKASAGDIFDKKFVSKEINLFNCSYFVGGGIEYNIAGETNLLFGINYNNGFIDIFKKKGSVETLCYVKALLGIIF